MAVMGDRVEVFVDGFNLYHALQDHRRLHQYKWLNLRALADRFVRPRDQVLGVYYFTAFANWMPDKVQRHKVYIRALRSVGVEVVHGEFKMKDRRCRLCHKSFKIPEEKRTDVNIAIHLFQGAIEDRYDRAVIISGDSDLIPALQAVKHSFPSKEITVVLPIGRHGKQLVQTADSHMRMKEKHLRTSQFDDPVALGNGMAIPKPSSWA